MSLILPHQQVNNQAELNTIAPLGINAISVSTPRKIRAERYSRQEKIQKILKKNTSENLYKRVKLCTRAMLSHEVGVHRSKKHGKAFYSQLVTCGNVWLCPVCSAKIQSRRAIEISRILQYAYSNGYTATMVTFTHPHSRQDSLESNIERHNTALKLFRGGRVWSKFKQSVGFVGLIRVMEITHGANGWHAHTHELWITQNGFADQRDMIVERWRKSCKSAGFKINNVEAFNRHSVDVMSDCHASDYLQKMADSSAWGADKELVNGSAKKTKGLTPFELAEQNEAKFIEYVLATKGRKQMYRTPALLKLAGLRDKTDEELATEKVDEAELICFLDSFGWSIIRRNHIRTQLLDVAEEYGYEGVCVLLAQYGYTVQPPS